MDWNEDDEEAIMNEFNSYEVEEEMMMPFDDDDDNNEPSTKIISETTAKSNLTTIPSESMSNVTTTSAYQDSDSMQRTNTGADTVNPWTVVEKEILLVKPKETGHSMKKSFAFMTLHSSLDFVTKIAEQIHYCDTATDFLHTVPPSAGEYISCTLTDGTKYFLSKRTPVEIVDTTTDLTAKSGQLLQISMSTLTEKALELEMQSKLQKSLAAELKVTDLAKSDILLYENLALEKSLWVEKYKPRGFSQLLSPENINREVLRALKQWDRYVFKRANPTMPEKKPIYNLGSSGYNKQYPSAGSNSSTAAQKPKEFKRKSDMDGVEDNSDIDDNVVDDDNEDDNTRVRDVRPEAKVFLLSGPPGTGKTTLAHILALHCGYRPFEINASDDRTLEVLRDKIVSVMTANTVTGDKRPNCIILDEADGIDNTATIEMIVNMVKAPLRGDAKSTLNALGKKTKKGAAPSSTATPLTRPIICICNDHFAPVLKSLKKVAQIFVFQAPSELRLTQRLKSICTSEGVDVHNSLLSDLCTASGNDIRSCLNSLQFAAMKALVSALGAQQQDENGSKSIKKDITSTLMNMMKGGLNDKQKDVFSIWKEIFNTSDFNKQRAFKQKLANESGSSMESSGAAVYEILSTLVNESGDSNLILSGVHENLPKARFNDPDMSRLLVSMEWLSFTDYVEQFARTSSGGYQVMGYAAAYAPAVHLFCAQENRSSKLEWPFKDRTEFYKRQQRGNVLHSLVYNPTADLHCRSSLGTNKQAISLDVLSALVDILAPRIRAISWTSLSPHEREALLRVVEVMASCGLSFVSASSVLGNSTPYRPFGQENSDLILEPNITELIQFTLPKTSTAPGFVKKNFGREERINLSFHTVLQDETKRVIQRELKTFLIHNKHDTPEPNMADASTGQVVDNTSAPKNSDSYYNKRGVEKDEATETLRDAEDAEEERQIQMRAKRGRMDMFCTTKTKTAKLTPTGKGIVESKAGVPVNKNFGTTKATLVSVRPKLFFKFNQGSSNAVKRPVPISEFM